MKRTLRCPSCDQRIRVEVPDAPNRLAWLSVVFICSWFVLLPFVLMVMVVWGSK